MVWLVVCCILLCCVVGGAVGGTPCAVTVDVVTNGAGGLEVFLLVWWLLDFLHICMLVWHSVWLLIMYGMWLLCGWYCGDVYGGTVRVCMAVRVVG